MKQGVLLKMQVELGEKVKYTLNLGTDSIEMNALLGTSIAFNFHDIIHCVRCGRVTKKSFAQGYCYPCFSTAPETSECIIRPELCLAHEGVSRDMKWSEGHCLQDHIVYLALSSGLKVGVTRSTQVPTRWIDQGAWKAIPLARTPNRHLAGKIEVTLKAHMSDRTNWRNMLTNKIARDIELVEEKQKAVELLQGDLQQYVIQDNIVTEINYPVLQFPEKVNSLGFDKTKFIEGVLNGIKGQYLIFENGSVLNVRKHGGYLVSMEY
ncbi:hypothetical protein LCGC14_2775780 [marine sediment metagenome]|uniref:DUF2797 domain-containing protein n=1 Tax=marine sediment metagenome TaxID=412755 RepID=A0A0F9B3I3_9ZZZZ|nr:DUF2797 domain-containing protein [Bacteroides sp.]